MRRLQYETTRSSSGTELRLVGEVRRDVVRELCAVLKSIQLKSGESLSLNLADVHVLDSAAIAAIVGQYKRSLAAGTHLKLSAVSPDAERALAMFRINAMEQAPHPQAGAFESVGASFYSARDSVMTFLQLTADSVFAVVGCLIRPSTIRWKALIEQAIDIGSRALGIVALITFLVGLTVAFQSAHQLRQFGAAIFVADLTAVSMVREMAPLMTAILVAGRSGASIAAEVATMKVSEEVDALTVMGIDPIDFLGGSSTLGDCLDRALVNSHG